MEQLKLSYFTKVIKVSNKKAYFVKIIVDYLLSNFNDFINKGYYSVNKDKDWIYSYLQVFLSLVIIANLFSWGFGFFKSEFIIVFAIGIVFITVYYSLSKIYSVWVEDIRVNLIYFIFLNYLYKKNLLIELDSIYSFFIKKDKILLCNIDMIKCDLKIICIDYHKLLYFYFISYCMNIITNLLKNQYYWLYFVNNEKFKQNYKNINTFLLLEKKNKINLIDILNLKIFYFFDIFIIAILILKNIRLDYFYLIKNNIILLINNNVLNINILNNYANEYIIGLDIDISYKLLIDLEENEDFFTFENDEEDTTDMWLIILIINSAEEPIDSSEDIYYLIDSMIMVGMIDLKIKNEILNKK